MPTTALISAAVGAAGSIGASVIGANAQSNAANKAIAAQQQALQQGQAFATNELTNAQTTLQPFIDQGGNALSFYNYLTGTGSAPSSLGAGAPTYNPLTAPLTKTFSPSDLTTTPGYLFDLNQGLKATQNSFAAQGLGTSGAALKGASAFTTGKAQDTYNQQFQNYLTQNQQIGNLLLQPAGIGSAAAGTLAGLEGQVGAAGLGANVSTGQGIANSLTGQGNAIAAAATGSANALTGGINSALQYSLLAPLYQSYANNIAAQNTPNSAFTNTYLPTALSTSNPFNNGAFPGANAFMANGYIGG